MEDILDIVHLTNSGKTMDIFERYYICKKQNPTTKSTTSDSQTNAISENLIHEATHRGHSNS
jgi:hypothetical protein